MSTDFEEMFLEDAGIGQESMDKDDFAIPRLAIAHPLSPQLNKQKAEYIPDAEPGDIFDTVSGAVYDGNKGITVIPISYRRAYVEWILRTEGGGFVADHGSDGSILNTTTKDEKGQDITKDGTQIVTTAEYFVFVLDKESCSYHPAVISMAATQLKKARRWNTIINQFRLPKKAGGTFNPPMYARTYSMTTVPESNKNGSWFGWDIKPSDTLNQIENGTEIYAAAKSFRGKVLSGELKASQQIESSVEETDDDPI